MRKRSKTRKSHSKLKRIEELEKQVLELNRTIESRNNHSSSVECSNHLNSQTLFGVNPSAGGSCGNTGLHAGGSISGDNHYHLRSMQPHAQHIPNNLESSAQKSDMLLASEPSLNLTFNHTREQLLLASGATTQVLPPHQLSQALPSGREDRAAGSQGGNNQPHRNGKGRSSKVRDPAKETRGRHGRKRSRDA